MAPRASSGRDVRVRGLIAQVTIVALWLGAAALFTLSVAPGAFAVLPSRDLAGALVGRILPVLFWAGAAMGAILVVLEIRGRRLAWRRTRITSATLLVASCLIAQLQVAPRIAELRAGMNGPLASLAPDDPARVAFGRLHMFSVAWLGVAMLGGTIFLAVAAITLDREEVP